MFRRRSAGWKPLLSVLGITLVAAACAPSPAGQAQPAPAHAGGGPVIAIHGGAGTILREQLSAELEAAIRAELERSLRTGHAILARGGSALDAVEAAVRVLEDSPHFNAGRGAVFTAEGTNELDAAIMDGNTLMAGAVAGVMRVKNPITLARLVMERSPHVFMAREGAEAFGQEHGIEMVEPDYFFTQRRWDALQRARDAEARAAGAGGSARLDAAEVAVPPVGLAAQGDTDPDTVGPAARGNTGARAGSHAAYGATAERLGTVGAVALDLQGRLAAATSTGGMTNKRFGRIGDVPVIGAGTYANDRCAISATGHGEFFIRNVVAFDICARATYYNIPLVDAADAVIMMTLVDQGGDGGVIALDAEGNISTPFNTPGMYRGFIDRTGRLVVEIFRD